MNEIAVRESAGITTVGPEANFPTGNHGAMRLVEWAEEAAAANHLAKALCHTPFAGSWKGDENGATAAILKGSEVGLTPVTALGAFDNIQGTPAPKAITLRALVQAHGHELEIVEESDQRAVARYRRKGAADWSVTEFTIEHARAMNLLNKDNWKKQPGAMLVARVTSKAARLVASDVILGIGYSAEEIRDEAVWDGTTRPPREVGASGADRMRGMLTADQGQTLTNETVAVERLDPPTSGEGGAPDGVGAPVDSEPTTPSPEPLLLNTSSKLAKAMYAGINEAGIPEAERIAFLGNVIGREIASSKEMTEDEARNVLAFIADPSAES